MTKANLAAVLCGLLCCVPWAWGQGGSGRSGGSSGNTSTGGGGAVARKPPPPRLPRKPPLPPTPRKPKKPARRPAPENTSPAKPTPAPETSANASMKPLINSSEVQLRTNAPLVTFRLLFRAGAANDPEGKEGVASLTAAMLAEGGSRELTYEQIVEAMYPLAASFSEQVDKEMTVFSGTTHIDNLDAYYKLARQMLLDPGFREEDFTRLKDEALNFLKISLREGNDEELGKEALYLNIYNPQHPYGHHNAGTVSSLEKLTLQDVKDFYATNYTETNLVIGLAGGFPPNFAARVKNDFAKLPAGNNVRRAAIPAPVLAPGLKIEIVQRETRSTAISLGFPITVTRADKDWPALALVTSYFGQHRSSNSHLYQRLREVRGLNYGNYAYLEYFPRGMYQFKPDPNQARQQQIFQIWIRPVETQHSHFALRAALYEYEKLLRDGLSQEDFESTRAFLIKNVNLLVADQDAQLGYWLDSRYYDLGEFTEHMRQALRRLTLEEVNANLRKHLQTDKMRVVMVTKDAEGLRTAIVSNRPSPISYNAPKDAGVLAEDKVIQTYPVNVRNDDVRITPVGRVFQ